jgi:uncharacterized OB-fold protein
MSDFRVPACANCGHAIWPPRLACAVCGAAEWDQVDAPTGRLEDVTEAPGYDGESIRIGTVRLEPGPPVIAAVGGDAQAGDLVDLELVEGALHARPHASQE